MSWNELEQYACQFHLKPEYISELKDFFERDFDEALQKKASSLIARDFPEEEIAARYPEMRDRNQFRLLCAVACYPAMAAFYEKQEYPVEMLEHISWDLEVWVETLYRDLGYAGLSAEFRPWFACTLDGRVKQMGRLQFNTIHLFCQNFSFYRRQDGSLECRPWLQRGNFPRPDLSWQDKVINIHIPAGRPLLRRECIRSIRQAAAFSEQYQPDYDYKAFVCYSWLLDPAFRKILPASSNILEFQRLGHNFVIPEVDQTATVLWRIWGDAGRPENLDRLEKRNSLQKNVAAYLQQGGRFVEGGLIIFRDELPDLFAELMNNENN